MINVNIKMHVHNEVSKKKKNERLINRPKIVDIRCDLHRDYLRMA